MSYKYITNLNCDRCNCGIDYDEGHCARILRRRNMQSGGAFIDGEDLCDECFITVQKEKTK